MMANVLKFSMRCARRVPTWSWCRPSTVVTLSNPRYGSPSRTADYIRCQQFSTADKLNPFVKRTYNAFPMQTSGANILERVNRILPGTTVRDLSSSNEESSQPSSSSEIKENIFTIPNMLTMSRIVLTPVLGYCVLNEWYLVACSIFIYAGATDMLDGWIARRYASQMSSFGSFLDPLADKLLVSTLFITLTMMNLIPLPLTAIVIGRDILLIAAAFYVRYISLPPPITLQRYFNATHVTSNLQPLFISKLNTALQLGLVGFTLCAPVFSYVDHPALQALWYITAATTISSGVCYMFAKDTFKIISKAKQNKLK